MITVSWVKNIQNSFIYIEIIVSHVISDHQHYKKKKKKKGLPAGFVSSVVALYLRTTREHGRFPGQDKQ